MACSSVQLRDRIFVKGYGFLSFVNEMGKNICKNISKNLTSKYNQEILDTDKRPVTAAFRSASERTIQKTAEAIDNFMGNKIADKITKISKTSPKNDSETNKEKILIRERYISPGLRQKIVDDVKLKEEN